MSNIYDLTEGFLRVYEQISNGEDSQLYLDTLESINVNIENKANGYAKIIKSVEGDNEAISKEIKRLQDRKKSNDNAIKNLKSNLQFAMERTDKKAFRTELFSFGIQNNPPKATVTDENKLPKKYYVEQEPKLDKKLLLDDLKNQVEIDGASITQDAGLRIR